MSEDNEGAPAIAIDLGTTNSCVAVFREGQVKIIPNDHGNRTTPSCVVFNKKGRLIGDAAKKITSVSPTSNSVYDVKRLIGRRFDDASSSLQEVIDHLPMNVTDDEGNPVIKVVYKEEEKTFYPEEMSAMVLLKMKETAEAHLGEPVTKAVITVPAHFNSSQRRATKDAGRIAGLNVLQIMNEPSAAVLAYAFKEKVVGKKNVLVFSLGEWSCDVSVVAMYGGSCKVKSTIGDTRIGGQHFNTRMIDHFVQEIKNKHKTDVSSNKEALLLLRAACDAAKKLLSTSMEATINVTILVPRSRGIHFQSTITRVQFEEINDDLFFSTLELIRKALRDAGMDQTQIHKVILEGGSSRIPKIQTLLKIFFSGKELYQSINVQEIVAYGAAIQGAIRLGDKSHTLNQLGLSDVVPFDLGIGDSDDMMRTFIKANTAIPVVITSSLHPFEDNQRIFQFEVFEGKSIIANENFWLGTLTADGIIPGPKHATQFLVTFSIGLDGILSVSVVTNGSGPDSKITTTYDDSQLGDDLIAKLTKDAERYRLEDIRQQSLDGARDAAVSYYRAVKSMSERLTMECKRVINLLVTNQVTDEEDLAQKKEMVEHLLHQIRSLAEYRQQQPLPSAKRPRTQ